LLDYRFSSSSGLFPSVFNLAESSVDVFVNATCGEHEPEVFCTLASGVTADAAGRYADGSLECGVCDAGRADRSHSVDKTMDGNHGTWWQSPSLQYGGEYNYVTLTVDLKNIFQVSYLILKSGPSPRPGNWILERSLNGHRWAPWQYFASTDRECWRAFGVEPTRGKPAYKSDDEVICTSYFSNIRPLENGEIHVSLTNGRPGASGPSLALTEFTRARFIRMRMQRVVLLPADAGITAEPAREEEDQHGRQLRLRQYFYSLRDVAIGGECPCNGHAEECPVDRTTMVSYTRILISIHVDGPQIYLRRRICLS